MPEPGNSDALSAREICDAFAQRIDTTDDLMARDQRQSGGWKIAAHDMQIRAANAAGFHPHPDLAGARDRIGPLFEFEATACLMKHHRVHGLTNHSAAEAARRCSAIEKTVCFTRSFGSSAMIAF